MDIKNLQSNSESAGSDSIIHTPLFCWIGGQEDLLTLTSTAFICFYLLPYVSGVCWIPHRDNGKRLMSCNMEFEVVFVCSCSSFLT